MHALPGPVVSASWLIENLDHVVVVDVRWYLDGKSGRAAYDTGHIPGAVFADLDMDLSDPPSQPGGRHPLPSPTCFAEAMSRLGIGDDSTVVAYDDASAMVAGRLWWMLDSLGGSVAVLDGGIGMWPGPLSTDTPQTTPANFSAKPWPKDRFATADEVAATAATVLDARSSARYEGHPNAIDPRFGHIPGALNAEWAANMSADGCFSDASALRAHYHNLGVGQHNDVIVYCGSGVSACTDLLALRMIGHQNARLYVGSWSEWGADHTRPIATGTD